MNTPHLLNLTITAILFTTSPVLANSDLARGGEIFEEWCSGCHEIGPEAEILVGPVLSGVIGRQAGTYEDFEYSDSMIEAGEKGLVWDRQKIVAYLPNPSEFLIEFLDDEEAESYMPEQFEEEQDLLDLAAYIATFKEGE